MSDSKRNLVVSDTDANIRLDAFLSKSLSIPRSAAHQLLASRGVRINGMLSLKKGQLLSPGQQIEISESHQQSINTIIPRPDLPLTILNQGPGWIAVDKPTGLPIHPLGPNESDTLLNAVIARYPQIQGIGEAGLRSGVVHRLDLDTTGVILFATEQPTWHHLRRAFENHTAKKIYHAIVAGKLTGSDRLILDLRIAQHSPARVKVIDEKIIPKPQGTRRCDLTWRATTSTPSPGTPGEGRGGGCIDSGTRDKAARDKSPHPNPPPAYQGREQKATLLEISLGTGFLHQIRVMLAHIGHPILGDTTYGPATSTFPRQMLHARSIRIGDIYAESPYPEDFSAALAFLGL